MTDLTPEQRARALELYRLHFLVRNGSPSSADSTEGLSDLSVRAWLAAEAHVLESHTCPDVESDSRIRAWSAIAAHPFFADCYQTAGTLVDAMVAKLDAAHTHTCEPVWRPASFEEIQAGWEVRSRRRNGSEAGWGVAHHRDGDGDWLTKTGSMLTYDFLGWTYETTAPEPEPEPWDEALVGVVSDALAGTEDPGPHWDDDARRVLDALAARGYLDRAAIAVDEKGMRISESVPTEGEPQ